MRELRGTVHRGISARRRIVVLVEAAEIAGVDAGVATGPAERSLIDRRLNRHVCGERRSDSERGQRDACEQKLFHDVPRIPDRPMSGSVVGHHRPAAEPVIEPEPRDVLVEAVVVHDGRERERTVVRAGVTDAAEIDVEILGLHRPIAERGPFETGADGPADPRLIVRCCVGGAAGREEDRVFVLQIREGDTAGEVEHPCAERGETGIRPAGAAADGAEPVASDAFGDGVAEQSGRGVLRLIDSGVGEVALDAPDRHTRLIVAAELAACRDAGGPVRPDHRRDVCNRVLAEASRIRCPGDI